MIKPPEVRMPTHLVNLDALIRREDFEAATDDEGTGGSEPLLKIEELERTRLYFSLLRKPDFQRTTNNWSPEMIVDFVESFLDGAVIPAIILWHSRQTNKVFVVDGAHRLSALIAWVNDDYGAGSISRAFYNNDIQDAQTKFHHKTQKMMADCVGTFSELLKLATNALSTDDPIKVRRGRAIAAIIPAIQRVEGDAKAAERSFLKINANPATIDKTELDIIEARTKPNAIAARALMRAGTAYFPKLARAQDIDSIAREVHDIIFGPITEISTQSPDVPRAGQPYSNDAFKMVLDMVNEFNDISPAMWRRKSKSRRQNREGNAEIKELPSETDGTTTIAYLNRLKDIGTLAVDNGSRNSGSLGLDPAVYSYGTNGKFYPTAFLASLKFSQWLKSSDKLEQFTAVREQFEEFLVRHNFFVSQLGHSKGGRMRPFESILTLHRRVLECMISGTVDDISIVEELKKETSLKDLDASSSTEEDPKRKKFSKSAAAAGVVKQILDNRERCTECGARLPPACRSKDHRIPASEGGMGSVENLAFTHPYCNTGYKERKRSLAVEV